MRKKGITSTIRETDAIVNVVRCFDDGSIVHVSGKVNPIADIETIGTELVLAGLAGVGKALIRESKRAKAGCLKLDNILSKQ